MIKNLMRPREGRTLLGVCAAVANYFNLDPSLVRLGWAILTLCSFGAGAIGYIVGAVIIPEEI